MILYFFRTKVGNSFEEMSSWTALIRHEQRLHGWFRSSAGHLDDLTLVLDDGTEIRANRELLTSTSPVFEAMLAGGFSEASKARYVL